MGLLLLILIVLLLAGMWPAHVYGGYVGSVPVGLIVVILLIVLLANGGSL